MNTKRFTLALLFTLLSLAPFGTAAQTTALSFTGHNLEGANSNNETYGWSFALAAPVLLTDLGVADFDNFFVLQPPSGDGLQQSHIVTIWNSITMAVVAQATVPSFTAGALIAGFRYVSLGAGPVLLPGTYTIGAYFQSPPGDHYAGLATGLTTAPGVSYLGSAHGIGNAFPLADGTAGAWFGPNFRFTNAPAGVPDSGSTFVLAMLSLGALLGCARLKARIA